MDLKIKDVSELLNVSETTIRRWLADNKIPAYKINSQYRFSRSEVEDWVLKQKVGNTKEPSPFNSKTIPSPSAPIASPQPVKGGHRQFSLFRALNNGGIYRDIAGETKEEVIANTSKRIAKPLDLDPAVLTDLLLDRERLMPTCLNNGIGMPHARDFLLDSHQDVVVLAFPKEPIEYGSLDSKKVHSLFFLFASEDKSHLHLLAKIAHLVSEPKALRLLESRASDAAIFEYIKQWEAGILREL